MSSVSTGSTSISFGSNLRIGYRVYGATTPFTYLPDYPSYNDLPFTYNVPLAGTYEIEYSTTCPNCGGVRYSDPLTTIVTVS